jgi:hypothetical protein
MANGKIKQGNAAVKAPTRAPKKATGNGSSRGGSAAPSTASGSTVKKPAVARRDAAGKF